MILKGFAMLSVAIKADAAPIPLIKLRREGVIVLLRLNNEQEIYGGNAKFQKGIKQVWHALDLTCHTLLKLYQSKFLNKLQILRIITPKKPSLNIFVDILETPFVRSVNMIGTSVILNLRR